MLIIYLGEFNPVLRIHLLLLNVTFSFFAPKAVSILLTRSIPELNKLINCIFQLNA